MSAYIDTFNEMQWDSYSSREEPTMENRRIDKTTGSEKATGISAVKLQIELVRKSRHLFFLHDGEVRNRIESERV